MPIFRHALVPISLSLLCPYMDISEVISIQYAHIWVLPHLWPVMGIVTFFGNLLDYIAIAIKKYSRYVTDYPLRKVTR